MKEMTDTGAIAIGSPLPAMADSHLEASKRRAGDLTARLDRLPATRHIWKIVFLVSLGGFFEFYDLFLTAYIAPGLIHSNIFVKNPASLFSLNSIAAFSAFTFIGLLIGTMGLGFLADKYGRRPMFVASLLIYTAANILMALQDTPLGVDLFRMAAGVGLGIQMVTINVYIAEMVPKHERGRAFTITHTIWYCGVPTVGLVSWWLLPQQPFGIDGWRWVVLLSVVGAAVVWFIRMNIPESPRWLLSRGKLDEAEKTTINIERMVEAQNGGTLPPPEIQRNVFDEKATAFRDLFSGKYFRRTFLMSCFNLFSVIGFYGFSNWVPSLLAARGVNLVHSIQYTFLMSIALPLGPAVFFLVSEKFERKWAMVASSGAIAVLGLAFAMQSGGAGLISTGFLLNMALTIMSYSFLTYQNEIFPTYIRARAVGFVYSWSRLGAIFSGYLVLFFLNNFGVISVFVMISSCMAINMVLTTVLGPRTMGRALEDIN